MSCVQLQNYKSKVAFKLLYPVSAFFFFKRSQKAEFHLMPRGNEGIGQHVGLGFSVCEAVV